MKSQTSPFLSLVTGILALAIFAAAKLVQFFNWNLEDSYIVYRIASNLAFHHEWAYNIGQRYNPSTSVLNTVLIALLGKLLPATIPSVAHILGALTLFFSGVLLLLILRDSLGQLIGGVAGLLLMERMANNGSWGLEPNLLIALILLFIWCEQRKRDGWLVLGLAVLARPDAIVLVGLKWLNEAVSRKTIPAAGLLKVAAPVLPWAAFSLWKFGEVFPATLKNKMWQGRSGFWGSGYVYLGELKRHVHWGASAFWIMAALCLIGFTCMVVRRHPLLYLALFAGIQQLAYALLNVPAYHWYFAVYDCAVLIAQVFAVGSLVQWSLNWAQHLFVASRLSRVGVLASFFLLAFSLYGFSHASRNPINDSGNGHYLAAAHFLNSTALPSGPLAAVEVGTLGYYIKREIFDFIGLTTPNQEVLTGTHVEEFFAKLPAVVVLHSPPWAMEAAVHDSPKFQYMYGNGADLPSPHIALKYYLRQRETLPDEATLSTFIEQTYPRIKEVREGTRVQSANPSGNLKCVVDYINGALYRGGAVATSSNLLSAEGWIVDLDSKEMSNAALALKSSGDKWYLIDAARTDRPDVASHFNRPELTNIGYRVRGSLKEVPDGNYGLFILLKRGEEYLRCDPLLQLELHRMSAR